MPSEVTTETKAPPGTVNLAEVQRRTAKNFNDEWKENKTNTAVALAMLAMGGTLLAGAAALGITAATYFTSSSSILTACVAAVGATLAGITLGRWGLQSCAETQEKNNQLLILRQLANNPHVIQEISQGITGDVEKDIAHVTDWVKKTTTKSSYYKPRCI